MNNIEFISYIDEAIKQEMLLGLSKNENKLTGLRNIKSDFNYIASKNNKLSAIDILRSMYKERSDNASLYLSEGRNDLWIQENTELNLLNNYLPPEPSKTQVIDFLNGLNIPKQKSSFKKFQDACVEKFGQKIDSQIILDFINEN